MTTTTKSRKNDMATKALSRLMEALTSPIPEDARLSRMELIEQSIASAALALGEEVPSTEDLTTNMQVLAVQVLMDMDEANDEPYTRISVTHANDEESIIVATSSSVLAAQITGALHAAVMAPPPTAQ